jgi:hypothetical protein
VHLQERDGAENEESKTMRLAFGNVKVFGPDVRRVSANIGLDRGTSCPACF